MTSQVVLILGAGPNIGKSVAQQFKSKNYAVAVASRTLNASLKEVSSLQIKADFSDSSSIKKVFDEVHQKLGIPSVVVYNAAAHTPAGADPISVSLSKFENDIAVNLNSVYAAAQESIAGFEKLGSDDKTPKTFIYTGNRLNIAPVPIFLDLGVGKSAGAHLIQIAATVYGPKGYSFYYADERKEDGSSAGTGVSGEAAAKAYYDLAVQKEQGPWDYTFVNGKGYVDFTKAKL